MQIGQWSAITILLCNSFTLSVIFFQCVCNNRYQFYNVFTSYLLKSSVTSSTFLESPLAEMILNDPDRLFPNIESHIVGQCCFPLLPNLMTPFSDDTYNTVSQNTYNEAIEVPLNIIKLAFGKLLGRFSRLLYVQNQILLLTQNKLMAFFIF